MPLMGFPANKPFLAHRRLTFPFTFGVLNFKETPKRPHGWFEGPHCHDPRHFLLMTSTMPSTSPLLLLKMGHTNTLLARVPLPVLLVRLRQNSGMWVVNLPNQSD